MRDISHSLPRATDLLFVGVICSVAGLVLFWKVLRGDTLLPGTLWTHVPGWLLWCGGALLQLPLPLAYLFLKHQGLI